MRSTVVPAASRRLPSSPSCKLSPLSTALASMGVLLVMPVQAQTAATVSQSTVLEEVTVTGERSRSFSSKTVQVGTFRDQDPIDVPMTNNTVTREVLDAQGARTVHGALRNTAGVTRTQLTGATYDNIAVRGILVDNQRNYRLNGSLPIINLIDVPLENKERVEVLKGASSLYYGIVPPSGIVNFVTKRAGATPVTSVASSANNHGGVDAHVDIGRRFGQDNAMGVRFNAVAGKEEIGIDHYEGNRSLVSLAYDWRLTRAVNLKVDLEHYRKNVSEQAAVNLYAVPDQKTKATPLVPPLTDNRNNLGGEWQRYDAEATNLLVRSDISLSDNWLLTLETGRAVTKRDRHFSDFRFLTAQDLATGNGRLNVLYYQDQRFENTSHRGEVVGRFVSGPVAHELTVGVSTNKREASLGSLASANTPQNYFAPTTIAPLTPGTFTPLGTDDTTDKGLYVFDRMSFGERWQLLAGVRRSDFSNTRVKGDGTSESYKAEDTSPNVSLMYKPTNDVSLYGSYLEGLENTKLAPQSASNRGSMLPPTVSKQKEVGVKARAMPSLLVQAAFFNIERANATIDATNRYVLGGRTDYRGLELSASGELGRNWSVLASALFMDAEITQVGRDNTSELGRTPEDTAERTFSLFSEYRVPQVSGLALNAGAFYVGKRAVDNVNRAYVGGYTTFSVGSRYATKWGSTPVTLQANVDNATDKQYWAAGGSGYLGAGLPRTVRVAAKFDF